MKVAVIMNKFSGAAKSIDKKIIIDAFKDVNIESEVHKIEGSEIKNKVKQEVEKGVNVIVAAGGDGTVSTIANLLAGGKIPLGILPLGTLNHFAKDVGIPINLEEAAKIIAAGNIKKLDIGEVNGRKFINNSSIGFYPHMVKNRKTEEKQLRVNKWVAMFFAIINTFKRFPLYKVDIKLQDKSVHLSTSAIFIGNNKYKIEFFNPGVRSRFDEGILTLYLTHCKTRFCMVKLAFLAMFNLLNPTKDFENYFIKKVTLNTRKKKISVSLDGEVVNLNPPLEYRILPETLPVIVPVIK